MSDEFGDAVEDPNTYRPVTGPSGVARHARNILFRLAHLIDAGQVDPAQLESFVAELQTVHDWPEVDPPAGPDDLARYLRESAFAVKKLIR